jgi:quercetin dioxygenase-like cupin family protein
MEAERRMAAMARFLPPRAGRAMHGPGGERYLSKLSASETGGIFTLVELEVPPGTGPPLHRHTREDELFLVIEGELSFWVAGEVVRAAAGAVVYGPRDIPHTYKNRGDSPARAMVMMTPPKCGEFFRRFGEPLSGESNPPPDEAIIERITRLAPEYGIELLGPSPL